MALGGAKNKRRAAYIFAAPTAPRIYMPRRILLLGFV
jgi:hypothetical protein